MPAPVSYETTDTIVKTADRFTASDDSRLDDQMRAAWLLRSEDLPVRGFADR
jgi:hypothetical protein